VIGKDRDQIKSFGSLRILIHNYEKADVGLCVTFAGEHLWADILGGADKAGPALGCSLFIQHFLLQGQRNSGLNHYRI
jgi:hypothetical protein